MCEKENIFKNKVDFNHRGSNFALHLGTQEILGSYCNIFPFSRHFANGVILDILQGYHWFIKIHRHRSFRSQNKDLQRSKT